MMGVITTLIGLGKSGLFHLRYRRPPTDIVMNRDSTKEVKLMSMYTSEVVNNKRVRTPCDSKIS